MKTFWLEFLSFFFFFFVKIQVRMSPCPRPLLFLWDTRHGSSFFFLREPPFGKGSRGTHVSHLQSKAVTSLLCSSPATCLRTGSMLCVNHENSSFWSRMMRSLEIRKPACEVRALATALLTGGLFRPPRVSKGQHRALQDGVGRIRGPAAG